MIQELNTQNSIISPESWKLSATRNLLKMSVILKIYQTNPKPKFTNIKFLTLIQTGQNNRGLDAFLYPAHFVKLDLT